MTITVCGSLRYGVDLGSSEAWRFAEVDHIGAPTLEWFDPSGRDDEDFAAQAHRVLLADSGIELGRADWGDLQDVALARLGVEVDRYGWRHGPGFVLATYAVTSYYDDPGELDLTDLERRRVADGWDRRLANALGRLGITPTVARPRWLLTAGE